jgi:L-serine dehydratase
MRITYDFYQRAAKLPADKLATATKLQVNLFGSLSATGKGHGTERAALAGLVGKNRDGRPEVSRQPARQARSRCSR